MILPMLMSLVRAEMCMYSMLMGVISAQENLHCFSWYKGWMNREEAEEKMRDYREVRILLLFSINVIV